MSKCDDSLARRKWISFPKVQVPEVITRRDGRNELYTAYKIVVRDGPDCWSLYKRFTQFSTLHAKLKENYQEEILPTLPEKQWSLFDISLLWREDTFLESRRFDLEQYLQSLLTDAQLLQSSEVRAFLQPEHMSPKKKMNAVDDPDMFLLPAPPSCTRRIPQIVLLTNTIEPVDAPRPTSGPEFVVQQVRRLSLGGSGSSPVTQPELCHVSYLLNSIKDCLEYVMEIKKEFEVINGALNRLEYLEARRGRITSNSSTLKIEQQTLSQLIKHPEIASNNDLKNYFQNCSVQINKAMKWLEFVENEVIEQLYAEVLEKRKTNSATYEAALLQLEQEAENVIVSSVNVPSEVSTSRAMMLQQKIIETKKKSMSTGDEAVASRLNNLQNYLQVNFSLREEKPEIVETVFDLD